MSRDTSFNLFGSQLEEDRVRVALSFHAAIAMATMEIEKLISNLRPRKRTRYPRRRRKGGRSTALSQAINALRGPESRSMSARYEKQIPIENRDDRAAEIEKWRVGVRRDSYRKVLARRARCSERDEDDFERRQRLSERGRTS